MARRAAAHRCWGWAISQRPCLSDSIWEYFCILLTFTRWEVSKTAILPLTVLMHYDDIPTTDCRPSTNPFKPHFVGWMECNQPTHPPLPPPTLWLLRTGTVISGWRIGRLMAASHQPSIGTLQTGKVVVPRYWNSHMGWKAFNMKKNKKNK